MIRCELARLPRNFWTIPRKIFRGDVLERQIIADRTTSTGKNSLAFARIEASLTFTSRARGSLNSALKNFRPVRHWLNPCVDAFLPAKGPFGTRVASEKMQFLAGATRV